MNRFLVWSLLILFLLAGGFFLVRSAYTLDSKKVEAAIKSELPPGTPKAKVLQFIQARHPVAWDDLGTQVKARMTGRAGNLIYRKDIVLDFEFDANGNLLSHSKVEYLTFY